jgi:hypothetical protein
MKRKKSRSRKKDIQAYIDEKIREPVLSEYDFKRIFKELNKHEREDSKNSKRIYNANSK